MSATRNLAHERTKRTQRDRQAKVPPFAKRDPADHVRAGMEVNDDEPAPTPEPELPYRACRCGCGRPVSTEPYATVECRLRHQPTKPPVVDGRHQLKRFR